MKKMVCLLVAALILFLGFYGDGDEVKYTVEAYVETVEATGIMGE